MAIRITHAWQAKANIQRLTASRSNIGSLQEQAFNGKKLQRASDGPQYWNTVETLSSNQRDQKQYTENSSRALSILSIADGTLGSVSNLIKRVKELAVGGASEQSVDLFHSAALTEITSLREQLVGLANQEYAGRYVFGGTAYDTPPFDATGTYTGSTDEPSIQVSKRTKVLQGIDGSSIFKGPTDIFGLMDDLAAAFGAQNADGVFDLIDEVDASLDQVLYAQQRVGTNQLR
ncbi:MAG: flagellar hook-associated protein 3 FlgL, partial [Myxococcota bacterium]